MTLDPDRVATGIRPPVGRERELAALVHLLERTDELPAVAAVIGDAGIGKTTLSLAAAEAARMRGYRVLSCRPSETEARFSFSGLADLIGGAVSEILPHLPPPQRRALEGALALSESDGKPADEGVVAFAFLNVLQRLATTDPLLLAIDDMQWLDAPSTSMLRFALPRLEKLPVAAILTAREEVPPWLRRAMPDERLVTVELGPLSVGATREMLRTRLATLPSRPALLRIWETSGGNPFFALELAGALQRQGGQVRPGEDLPIPANLGALIQERLDRLDADSLEIAQIVAALASPTVSLVEAAAGAPLDTALSIALDAGILEIDGDRLRFTHPLLRSAVASRSAPSRRRSLHARLARLVPDPEVRARHLALASARPSRDVALTVEDAARKVHARGAADAAAELAELAIRLTPPADVEDIRRRVLQCAELYRQTGDGRRAIVLLEQAYNAAPPGAIRAGVQAQLAGAVEAFVGPREAAGKYREALEEAEGDDALLAEIHLRLAALVMVTEERNLALVHAELAVEAASRTGDPALRCRALSTFGLIHFRLGRGVPYEQMNEALALERSLPEAPLPGPATWTLAHQLVWSGELERARSVLGPLRDELNAREQPEEAETLWYLAIVELRAGNWKLAAQYAADSLALRAQFGLEGAQAVAEMPAAAIAAHRGQIEEARDRSQRALRLAEEEGVLIAQSAHRWVLGFIELSHGNAAGALAHLERGWEIRDSVLLFEPGQRLELADTLEALISVGRLGDAERRIVEWEERSRAVDRSWAIAVTARCRGLLLAAHGDLAGAQLSFEHALSEHARTEDPFQHARTLLAYGVTQRRARQRGAARATLERALAIFERLGAPLWAEKARAELGRIGGRATSRGELTGRAPNRDARRRGPHQPRCSSGPLRYGAHGRRRPNARLPEARRPFPRPAGGAA